MLRVLVLAVAVGISGAQSVKAQSCQEGFSNYDGTYAMLGELHRAPYGDAPFWCQLYIGANSAITTVSCNPVLTKSAGVVRISLSGRLQVDTAFTVTGYIDVNFSSAIRRRYNLQGQLTISGGDKYQFIAIGTNGPISAPLSEISLAAAS